MKKKRLEELIDSTGSVISGDYTISHDFGSDKTSDQFEKMTRQGASNFYGYRRFWGENDENKPYSELADKLQNDPKKFYSILKKNNKVDDFTDYFTNDPVTESEELMKDMLEDIVKNKRKGDILPKESLEMMSLEEYSDEDPILAKWVFLVKELWLERQNDQRLVILNSLIDDVNFNDIDPNIKNILINKINGE
tara:strand:+ start:1166 stop:1747 length:582 start_codon:yes stop_codon:yes gene_type:complete